MRWDFLGQILGQNLGQMGQMGQAPLRGQSLSHDGEAFETVAQSEQVRI
jgi:hypothetical protein